MKKIIKTSIWICVIFLAALTNPTFGQNLSTVNTQYSKTDNGSIGKENYSFNISNGTITITDLDYNKSETHEPLKHDGNGFDEKGLYYDTYNSDIKKDPAGWLRERKKPRVYKFYYDKKNGNLLMIIEVKTNQSNTPQRKIFFTEQGYLLLNSPKKDNSQNRSSSNFDISNILLNASSLSQITSKIVASFIRDGTKKYSNDMSYYSFNYKNESMTTVVISYKTSNDEVSQIFFLMPKEEAVEVGKKSFITNFQQKQGTDNNAVWVNSNTGLTYEAGYDGDVGIIVVK